MPKKELPKAPFFLFDIEKMITENDSTSDLLKEQFFSKAKADDKESKSINRTETSKLKKSSKRLSSKFRRLLNSFQA